jgi:hypothetical protein
VLGSVIKLRRACGLNEWRAETGRSVRSITFDMIQLSWKRDSRKKSYKNSRSMLAQEIAAIELLLGNREAMVEIDARKL